MIKNIVRECSPESADLSWYFDGDCYNENSGDYNNTVFIIQRDYGRISGYNIDEYKRVMETAESVLDGFSDVDNGLTDYDGKKYTYKSVMLENNIPYTSHKCHLLREWAEYADTRKPESISEYLTITTGKTWNTASVHGYCQGDYAELVYCADNYKNGVKALGEVYLGCAKEFGVIDLDENGEETDSCWGYIVADCEARDDDDYKRLVCEWAGIKPEETRLEMIDGYSVQTVYKYRTA